LEEFGARKRGIKQGRCDLYIYPNGKRKGEYIEAKQVWSKYNERKEEWNLNQIQPSLTLAMKNAQDIIVSKDDPSIKIGLIFIAPYIYRDCKHKIDHHIETIIKDVPSARYDAFAWSFPAIVRNLNGGGQYKNFIFPGVMLLASVVEKKN